MVKIAASLLSADFSRLQDEVRLVEEGGVHWLHFDIMDGHFVPNITMGAQVVKSLRSKTGLFFDVHLMVENPERYLTEFADAGTDLLTVSVEACPHLHRVLQLIRSLNIRAGAALNPATPLTAIEYVLDELDLVLVMSVNPGFGGQQFIPSAVPKIRRLKELIGTREIEIAVDGGVNTENAPRLIEAGAGVLVAGTSIFGADDAVKAIKLLQTERKMV